MGTHWLFRDLDNPGKPKTTLSVREEQYRDLVKIKGYLSMKHSRDYSFADIINVLLDSWKNQNKPTWKKISEF